jgi:hypothetical protein
VDHIDQSPDMIDWRVWKDTMAQVEDVSTAPRRLSEDLSHLALDLGRWCEEDDRVEVTLDGDVRSEAVRGQPQVDPPVQSDHVPAGIALQFKERTGIRAEVDGWYGRVEQGE